MKITFTRGTALGGVGNDAYPGEVRDIPDAQARQLIAQGRAVLGAVKQAAPAKKSATQAAPEGAGAQAGEEGQGA